MPVCQPHNLNHDPSRDSRPYGIRVTLKPGNPFRTLLGDDWQKLHWYASAQERDAALASMANRHPYYRIGDIPDLRYEKIEKLAESRGR
jgi:hypothetical protein